MAENEKDENSLTESQENVEQSDERVTPAIQKFLDKVNVLFEKEKEKSLRLQADYQNLEKQTIDRINIRGDKIILDFLTVYEDFIRTKDAYEKEGGNVDSLNGIIKNMVTILDHYEVKPIEAEGIIVGLPPWIIAAAELLVPKSIPIILSAIFYHLLFNYFFF